MDRRSELSERLTTIRERIVRACHDSDRDPETVRLLPVTKGFPAEDAALLADLGVTDLAENRDQEAVGKTREVAQLNPQAPIGWHMVGRLQRNKARSVARWAASVQSVDSSRLVDALAKSVANTLDAGERDNPLSVLIQVSLDADPDRGGCPIGDLPELAEHIAARQTLRLDGLMAVAPLQSDPASAFERLAQAAEGLRRQHPHATELSAGMSHDLEHAIRFGSTQVRVGTALLGRRSLTSQDEVHPQRRPYP